MNKAFVLYVFGLFAVSLAIGLPSISWISPATYLFVFPVVAIWLWKSDGHSLRDLGFRFNQGWYNGLIRGLLFGLAIPISLQVAQILCGWTILSPRGEPIGDLPIYLLRILIQMTLTVAIEEFIFRGYFFQTLEHKAGIVPTSLLTSLLWGLGHITAMIKEKLSPILILIGMTTFLIMGIALCISYLKAKKLLWLPFGIHFGVNISFSLIGWFFITKYNAPDWWIGNPAWSPESGLIGILAWTVIAFVLWSRIDNKKRSNSTNRL